MSAIRVPSTGDAEDAFYEETRQRELDDLIEAETEAKRMASGVSMEEFADDRRREHLRAAKAKREGIMKFCRDCKHVIIDDGGLRYAKCGHEKAATIKVEALVSGEGEAVEHLYCMTMRAGTCGAEAMLFESRIGVVAGVEP